MANMYRIAIFLFAFFISWVAQGQTPLEVAYQNITQGNTLPEELLSTRTAVFLQIPPVVESHPQHWKTVATQLHSTLADLNIDAVAYYQWQDLNAGVDATRSYFETLSVRDISQVVLLNLDGGNFQLSIVPTTDDEGFLDAKAQTWHTSGPELSSILENLANAVRSSGPELGNFLVIDIPEMFSDTRIFKNNRFESFQADLKLDKLAVPLIGKDNPENLQLPANQQLKSTLEPYPYKYELVDYGVGEDILRRGGFQYVLLSLHASEASVRRLLNYPEPHDDGSNMVHKFYIRHIISGDIYLGDQWDGATTQNQALRNHLVNLKRFLKVE